MPKNQFLLILFLVGISMAFLVVCILVFFTKGQKHSFIARKLRLGGLILSLTALLNFGAVPSYSKDPEVVCYDVAEPSYKMEESHKFFVSDKNKCGDELCVDLTKNYKITGNVYYHKGENYSFRISDKDDMEKIIQQGEIVVLEKNSDKSYLPFEIAVKKTIPTGKYRIYFYITCIKEQNEESYKFNNTYILSIKNKKGDR